LVVHKTEAKEKLKMRKRLNMSRTKEMEEYKLKESHFARLMRNHSSCVDGC